MKKVILLYILFLFTSSVFAYPKLSENAAVSILTYSRTNEVHAMYGHTAMRINDPTGGFDMIFNYGMFDFRSDYFVYRFARGYTDYILGISNFQNLSIECYIRNMSVSEQVLNLTPLEKQRVFDFLMKNAEPENRTYRYNFLYDNCATRPRQVIENCVSGRVVYKDSVATKTFRALIHDCIGPNKWLTFGIDLVLGAPLDSKATYREQMFLPAYFADAFNRSVIVDSLGNERKMVLSNSEIIPANPLVEEVTPFWYAPNTIAALIFVLVFVVSFIGLKKQKFYTWIDVFLFSVYGLTGSIIFFMTFFSTHPATYPNYNLFVFHPLHLLFAICLLIPVLKAKLSKYYIINAVILAVFLLLARFLKQQFSVAIVLLTLTLFFRSLFHIAVELIDRKAKN